MTTLFILNDQPYGNERSYNALRLAGALAKRGSGAPPRAIGNSFSMAGGA